ncbi:MAG: hypothetical protein AAF996_17735 [Pseudomonadota bacterium]
MALFGGPRAFLTPEAETWQLDCWDWHLRQAGVAEQLAYTPLVLPNQEFFPALGVSGHERAQAIFQAVKSHAGLADWPVRLVAQNDMPAFLDGGAFVQHEGSCAGTFRIDETGEAVITYAPDLVDNPAGLIATLAHELGHYLNETFDSDPPGDLELNEPATDITSIILGYGIFSANHCLVHESFDSGYRVGKVGYLTEEERIFSLAIFLEMTGRSTEDAAPYLKKYLGKQLKKAMTYLRSEGVVNSLREQVDG